MFTALSFHHPPFSPSHSSTTSFLSCTDSIRAKVDPLSGVLFLPLSCSLRKSWGLPCCSAGKESACNAGDPGSSPELGRSHGEGNGNPLVFWPGELELQRVRCGWTTPTWNLELSLLTPVSRHLLLGASPEPCGEPHQFSTRLWAAQAWSVREHRRVLTISTLEEALVLSVHRFL